MVWEDVVFFPINWYNYSENKNGGNSMVQSLEAVLTKLQKIYQIKSVELESLQKESEIKKIAFVIAHLKDAEEISTYDIDKLKTFLAHITDEINLDNVSLACSVVSMTENPAIRMGKRFQDALELLRRIRAVSEEYLELQKELPTKLANCERSLAEMEDLFNVLANKVIVEDIDKYLRILEHELFPDDVHTVLTVVAAIVIRNATILEHPALIERPVLKSGPEVEPVTYEETTTFEGGSILAEIATGAEPEEEAVVEETVETIEEAPVEEKTEELIFVDPEEVPAEEEKEEDSIFTDPEEVIEGKIEEEQPVVEEETPVVEEESAEELIDDPIFIEPSEMAEVEEVVEELKIDAQPKEIVYNISSPDDENSFQCDIATSETIQLIEQLRRGENKKNINQLDNGMGYITGETEFILFKEMPNNHKFLLLNGSKDEIDAKLNQEKLKDIASSSIVKAIRRIIENNDGEYQKITALTEKVEEIFVEKGLKAAA